MTSEILQRLDTLTEAICKKNDPYVKDDLDFMKEALCSLPAYFATVIATESVIKIAYIQFDYDQDRLKYTVEQADRNRRSAHISLTMGINQLNRLCKMYNVPEIFPTGLDRDLDFNSKDDREIAVDKCYGFCKDMFCSGIERDKERDWTRDERDQDLYQISHSGTGAAFSSEKLQSAPVDDLLNGKPFSTLIKETRGDEDVEL